MICAKLVNREWLHGWLCSQLDYSQVSFSYISSWFQHENFKVFEPWELLIVLAQTSRNATLFTALAFFHSITASLSMLIIFDFFYYIVNEEFSPQLLLLVLPLTACLLDAIVIRPYIRLWYRNALFFYCREYLVLYTAAKLILYEIYSYTDAFWVMYAIAICQICVYGGTVVIAIHIVLAFSTSLLAIWVTRSSCLCFKKLW